MQLLIGFILGVVSSAIASFLFRWYEMDVPIVKQKRMIVFCRNPALYIKLRLNTEERRIKQVIERLFNAWENKDLYAYASCWADDAVRIIGVTSTQEEDKSEILEKFRSSCQKYSVIRVTALIYDDISIGPRQGTSFVKVHYRFELVRAKDGLPVVEESQEVYSLRLRDTSWQIATNIDHFYEIGPRDGA